MIGHGEWHKRVPRDLRENVVYRQKLIRGCKDRPSLRSGVIEACRRDVLFYVNSFVIQNNPARAGNEVEPFVTWPFQEEAILEAIRVVVVERKDLLWEKSREMGATWMALILQDWLCMFHSWKKFLAVSHSLDAVDRPEDPDCLFWKVQFMHEHLPDWLRRLPNNRSGKPEKRKLGFSYPATNSSFNGSASTGRSGVGGRATGVFLDELGKQEQADDIIGQTADTGPRLFVSTHYGTGTAFYRLTVRPDIRKRIMHWSDHPRKNQGLYRSGVGKFGFEIIDTDYQFPQDYRFVTDGSPSGGPRPGLRSPWYDAECSRRANQHDVAMHLDIDPAGSNYQFFDQLLIKMLIEEYCLLPPAWQGFVSVDQGKLAFTQKPGGNLKLWMSFKPDGTFPEASYGMGVDVAAGTGATPSCISVVNAMTGEKVLEYSSNRILPNDLGALASLLGKMLKNDGTTARMVWERHGPGISFGQAVIEAGYSNIYLSTTDKPWSLKFQATQTPGWTPSGDAKLFLLTNYREALAARKFINRSESALRECLQFEYTSSGRVDHANIMSSDPSGASVMHGDMVIADALAWKMAVTLGAGKEALKPFVREIPRNSLGDRRKRIEEMDKHSDGWGPAAIVY